MPTLTPIAIQNFSPLVGFLKHCLFILSYYRMYSFLANILYNSKCLSIRRSVYNAKKGIGNIQAKYVLSYVISDSSHTFRFRFSWRLHIYSINPFFVDHIFLQEIFFFFSFYQRQKLKILCERCKINNNTETFAIML